MKVTLIDYTGCGHADPSRHAAAILVFAKSTRLTMSPGLLTDILSKDAHELMQELDYIANTIPASQEFVDYTFMIEGVTRAFTHQFVRTRTGSYAQQTMRVLNVSDGPGWEALIGPSVAHVPEAANIYEDTLQQIDKAYKGMIAAGCSIEDARGILPTNIMTNIVAKFNLRNFVDIVKKRSSPRTQHEYRQVLQGMTSEVMRVHPWIGKFLDRTHDRSCKDLDIEIQQIKDPDKRVRMLKLVDHLRKDM